MLDTLAIIGAQIFLDLALAARALFVERDANLAVGGGQRFRRQSGIFALDVEIADLAKARDAFTESRPLLPAAAIDIEGQLIDQLHHRTDRVAIEPTHENKNTIGEAK